MRHRIRIKYKINSKSKEISEAIVSSKSIEELKMKLDLIGVNYDKKSDFNFFSFIFSYFRNAGSGTILNTGFSKPSYQYEVFYKNIFTPYVEKNIDKIIDLERAKKLWLSMSPEYVTIKPWKELLMKIYFKKHINDLTFKNNLV